MSDPNSYQVGGSHYKTAYEHWDMVLDVGLEYLEGCATKYISRWRSSKGQGILDLKKSDHYIAKRIDNIGARVVRLSAHSEEFILEKVRHWCSVNALSAQEADACMLLATYASKQDLEKARSIVHALLEQAPTLLAPKTVPASDSNKHADRIPVFKKPGVLPY